MATVGHALAPECPIRGACVRGGFCADRMRYSAVEDQDTATAHPDQAMVVTNVGAACPFDAAVALASYVVSTHTGNPKGTADVPAVAQEGNVSDPDHVVATGRLNRAHR